jgi:hypothetical protein
VIQLSGGLPGASVGETQGGEPSAIDISRHQGSSGQSVVQLSGGLPGASVGETNDMQPSSADRGHHHHVASGQSVGQRSGALSGLTVSPTSDVFLTDNEQMHQFYLQRWSERIVKNKPLRLTVTDAEARFVHIASLLCPEKFLENQTNNCVLRLKKVYKSYLL